MFEPCQHQHTIFGQLLTVRSMSRQEATIYRIKIREAKEDRGAMDLAMGYLVATCTMVGGMRAFKTPEEALAIDHRAFEALVDVCILENRPEDEQSPDPTPAAPVPS